MYRVVCGALVMISVPFLARASVSISEVAWMGSSNNANAEWIELYNSGSAQDLTGWSLSATDGKPNIILAGTIPANGYAVLERTNDTAVPGITALLIYTGGLGNTGEVLELRDVQGTLVDRVDGSDSWAIGGSNTTKETVQRSGEPSVGGFVTALPTPGRGGASQKKPSTPQSPLVETRAPAPPVTPPTELIRETTKPTSSPSAEKPVFGSSSVAVVATAHGDERGENPLWWYVAGLIAAIFATITIVFLVRQERQPEIIAGYEIESDE